MGRVVSMLVFCVLLAACGSQVAEAPIVATGQAEQAGQAESSVIDGADAEITLDTPCFTISGVELPDNYLATDVSPNSMQCWFVTQREGAADMTVIAGELWKNSRGNNFDDFVGFLESGLSVGQEPDLLPLQLLNTGPSGRNLPIIDRIELDSPNRATIFLHESDRRDGFQAMSAVVDVDTDRETDTTVIFMWGLVTNDNVELFPELINAMQLKPDFTVG